MIVHSIFKSINGEVNAFHQGSVCTFIRLAGCNLNCSYCDTKYARDLNSGKLMTIEEVIREVHLLKCRNITITGGEPMIQWESVKELFNGLRSSCFISVETNGSFFMPDMKHSHFSWCADWKLPSSGQIDVMKFDNFRGLTSRDFVKFVIANREDYNLALAVMNELHILSIHCKVAFSPLFPTNVKPLDFTKKLVDWMIEDSLPAVFSLQLHKIIGVG